IFTMTTPTHMKATILSKIGGPEGFEFSDDVPVPELKDGFVIVRNTFASIKFADVYFRTGIYPSSQGSNVILGQEASGFVEAAPEGNPFGIQKGDRVVWIFQGGYAQYTAVPITQVIKVPSGIADEDAAGVFLAGMTALALINEGFKVKAGDSVLVHAAAGGVGLLLCQALRERGAVVIGTAGGREKCDLALKYGASHMIDYRMEVDWAQKVRELTNGEGVDVVYDGVGKDTWEGSLAAVKTFGKVVFIGSASGPVPPFSLDRLTTKNISVMRPTLRNYIATRERLERYGNEALDMVRTGKWNVQKHGHYYSLEEVEQAHKDLETRVTTGKVLIRL
ncbi:Polyketide synthase enoylreductase, partial [Penicillium concentricum]